MIKNNELLKAIQDSYNNYLLHGARSTKKMLPLSELIGKYLVTIFGEDYQINYLGNKINEKKVAGKYYDKNIDITVSKNNKAMFCIGLKFITSNFKQNANNYFETMLGETANVQASDQHPYAHLIILRTKTPYLKKDKTVDKIEIINNKDIEKYLNLVLDIRQTHIPFSIGIIFIDIDEKTNVCNLVNPNEIKNLNVDLFNKKLSLHNFFKSIKEHKNVLKTLK